jgi:hypothetical protein
MRVALASLALLVACCSASVSAARTGTIDTAAPAAPVAHPAQTHPPRRAWSTNVSPAPGDLALVQLSFHRRHAEGLLRRSLRVAVSGAFGGDYLVVAAPREGTAGSARALILVVDRPSPLLDPLSVHLRVSARRSLGTPLVRQVNDPLTRPPRHPPGHPNRALCDLPAHGALIGSRLRPLSSRGAPLTGFDAAEAVAQAYDAACGLPVASSFMRAVAPSSGGCSTGTSSSGAVCCPPTAICAVPPGSPPTPTPSPPPSPTPEPPRCTPCDPRPGYACPLAARVSVCAAPLPRSARRASVSAY